MEAGEEEGWYQKRGEITGAAAPGRVRSLRLRLVVPMSFARQEAPMERDPDADEQGANKRFEPVENEHGAPGPFAHKPS